MSSNKLLIEYLEREAKRYFPGAELVHAVLIPEDETIKLLIDDVEFFYAAGADDEWYTFQSVIMHEVFTIPLQGE